MQETPWRGMRCLRWGAGAPLLYTASGHNKPLRGVTSEYMRRTPDLDERAVHTDLGVLPPLREEHRIREADQCVQRRHYTRYNYLLSTPPCDFYV